MSKFTTTQQPIPRSVAILLKQSPSTNVYMVKDTKYTQQLDLELTRVSGKEDKHTSKETPFAPVSIFVKISFPKTLRDVEKLRCRFKEPAEKNHDNSRYTLALATARLRHDSIPTNICIQGANLMSQPASVSRGGELDEGANPEIQRTTRDRSGRRESYQTFEYSYKL